MTRIQNVETANLDPRQVVECAEPFFVDVSRDDFCAFAVQAMSNALSQGQRHARRQLRVGTRRLVQTIVEEANRPQARRQKEQETMWQSLEKGDEVVTVGGVHGKVVGVTDDVLTVEIGATKSGDRVRVKVTRTKIESVQKDKKGDS